MNSGGLDVWGTKISRGEGLMMHPLFSLTVLFYPFSEPIVIPFTKSVQTFLRRHPSPTNIERWHWNVGWINWKKKMQLFISFVGRNFRWQNNVLLLYFICLLYNGHFVYIFPSISFLIKQVYISPFFLLLIPN